MYPINNHLANSTACTILNICYSRVRDKRAPSQQVKALEDELEEVKKDMVIIEGPYREVKLPSTRRYCFRSLHKGFAFVIEISSSKSLSSNLSRIN